MGRINPTRNTHIEHNSQINHISPYIHTSSHLWYLQFYVYTHQSPRTQNPNTQQTNQSSSLNTTHNTRMVPQACSPPLLLYQGVSTVNKQDPYKIYFRHIPFKSNTHRYYKRLHSKHPTWHKKSLTDHWSPSTTSYGDRTIDALKQIFQLTPNLTSTVTQHEHAPHTP